MEATWTFPKFSRFSSLECYNNLAIVPTAIVPHLQNHMLSITNTYNKANNQRLSTRQESILQNHMLSITNEYKKIYTFRH